MAVSVLAVAAILLLLLPVLLTACGDFSLSFGGLDTAPLEAEKSVSITSDESRPASRIASSNEPRRRPPCIMPESPATSSSLS